MRAPSAKHTTWSARDASGEPGAATRAWPMPGYMVRTHAGSVEPG